MVFVEQRDQRPIKKEKAPNQTTLEILEPCIIPATDINKKMIPQTTKKILIKNLSICCLAKQEIRY
jgi:hypothetical protein